MEITNTTIAIVVLLSLIGGTLTMLGLFVGLYREAHLNWLRKRYEQRIVVTALILTLELLALALALLGPAGSL